MKKAKRGRGQQEVEEAALLFSSLFAQFFITSKCQSITLPVDTDSYSVHEALIN